jgi:RNA polymerase sigma-70 factor (ECF subfamily)
MQLRQLLHECQRKNRKAEKSLYERFATPMFLVCRRYLKTDEEAEEVLMNGLLNFFRSLDKFCYESDAATYSWIKKIMINECLMRLRKNNSFLQLAHVDSSEAVQDDNVIDHMGAAEIFTMITQLPIGYRTVFNLYVVENFSHKEIAEALGISEGTSRSQLNKARRMLQQLLIKTNSDYASRKTK